VFVSEHDFLEAKQTGLTQKGMVIHNGIDISALRFLPRTEARKALGETIGRDLGSAFVVGSIGRLSHEKNYGFLIKTFPDVLKIKKDAVLVVIGDGPEHKEYEDAALALGIKEKVFLPGEIPGAPHYLAAFDVFVLPSRYEGLPITLVECLFAGTPVIASDVGGNREIAPAASLYGFDDKAKFLDVFSRAAKDPAAFVPHRTSADAFTGDAMAKEYLELFHG
jgi:glycosyltransferase involved in cell wall biosynthesis